MERTEQMSAQIRKLRKKLRQIEKLESLDRDLSDEELTKCLRKNNIREILLELLVEYNASTLATDDIGTAGVDISFVSSTGSEFTVSQSESDLEPRYEPRTDLVSPYVDEDIVDGPLDKEEISQNENQSNSQSDGHTDTDNRDPGPVPSKKQKKEEPTSNKQTKVSQANQGTSVKNSQESKETQKHQKQQNPEFSKKASLSKKWENTSFIVTELEGHNDLVMAVDCSGNLLVSGSRDTTVKVWDLLTLTELHSFGGHTESITDVALIPGSIIGPLADALGMDKSDHLILSGSLDCSLRAWSAAGGQQLRSIYTYSTVTKLALYPPTCLVLTASDGGKLELWDLDSKDNVCSVKAHEETVSGLCVCEDRVYTSCGVSGEIKVFEVRERSLHCIYVSENIHTLMGAEVTMRPILSLAVSNLAVYYGDDGVNLKILSWKKGLVKKVSNHKEEFGMTDAICCHDNLILASAYDLDNGQAYVNVFDITDTRYIATLDTEESKRILDVCFTVGKDGFVTMATAGVDLQVWKQVPKAGNEEDAIAVKIKGMLLRDAVDSDAESDAESTELESEAGSAPGSRRGSLTSQQGAGWLSWCSLV